MSKLDDLEIEKGKWEKIYDNCVIIEEELRADATFFKGKWEKYVAAEKNFTNLSDTATAASKCFTNGACYCCETSNSDFLETLSQSALDYNTTIISPRKKNLYINWQKAISKANLAHIKKINAKKKIGKLETEIDNYNPTLETTA